MVLKVFFFGLRVYLILKPRFIRLAVKTIGYESRHIQVGGGKHKQTYVIEKVPMGGYIISIFAIKIGWYR